MNRKKTKKWVEAKVQSYDGDDWGAPESEEDEEPDSPQAPPPVPRPAADQRLPSESRLPGAGRPGHLATGSTTSNLSKSSGGQTLSIQTQPTAAPANGVAPSSGAHDNVASPQSDQSQPLTRPTDIYHRMEEGKQKGEQAAEPTVTVAGVDEDPSGAGDAGPKRLSVSPQLPNVARMSGFGVDFFSNGSEPPANRLSSQPTVQEEREPTPEPQVEEETAKERDSVASGPTLPATTFTPPTSAKAEPEPEKSTESHESVPSENVSEDTTAEQSASQVAPPTQAEGGDVSPISKHGDTVKGLAAAVPESDSQKHLQAGQDARSLPPLRTPSPHEPRTVPPPVSDEAPAEPASEITPTEPLQPKKPEHSPSDYEPQPLERQLTIDTVTSSPVKESDVLSDEIMRTLTPGGLSPVDNRKSQVPRAGRESSYTLSGYDDYWADTADKQGDNPKRKSTAPGGLGDVPEHPPVPSAFTEAKSPEPMPVSPNSTTSPPLSGGQASLRRRFSWEAEEEQPPKPAPAVSPPSTITSPLAQNPVQSLPASEQPKQTASPGPTSPTIKVVPDTASVSEQVSQPSSAPAPSSQPSLEPPSPVSEVSDEDATPLGQPQGAQFPVTEDRSVEPSLPSSVSGTQHGEAPAVSPAVSSSAPTGQKIMTFREIMNIPTPANRIEKYSETRNVFASQDSGLENWITTMRNEYPEHARASASFSGVVLAPPPSANAGQAPGHQPSAQQPYYQQYLNATTPSNTGSARSRLAGIPQQAQAAAGSAFGHGGNQIGTKGKEFMQSAGKMGKGLFSKGKSKLRGTGDKVFH